MRRRAQAARRQARRALLLLALAACGGDGDGGAGDGGPPGADAAATIADGGPGDASAPAVDGAAGDACEIVLGGALVGSFPCTSAFSRRDGDATTTLGIGGTYEGPVDAISIAGRLRGSPSPGDLAEGDFESLVFTAAGGGDTFTASGGDGPSIGIIGRLTLSSVESRPEVGLTRYLVHGSFSAVLLGPEGHGAVTLTVTF